MPEVAETTAAANATSSSVPVVFSPGDVVALSISVVAAVFLTASFWCARRKLSARAVFPRDHLPRRKVLQGLKAGDLVAAPAVASASTPAAASKYAVAAPPTGTSPSHSASGLHAPFVRTPASSAAPGAAQAAVLPAMVQPRPAWPTVCAC